MRRSILLAAVAAMSLASAACMGVMGDAPAPTPADYAGVLETPSRPADDRARDAARHTAETLAFAQVRPGQKVADMIIGGGYFTRIFAAAVGPSGRVTAWQPAEFIAFQASYGESLTAVDALPNVDAIRSSLGAPDFPTGLDLVFTAQNYHDLHLNIAPANTAANVNAAIFRALKPGGLYVVIDHHAVAGAPLTAADTVHRIDIEAVKREVLAAGFVLDGESDVLANPADPLTASVFDASIRGRTSQFMLRFRKPG
ncbi:MAG: methyltransferase [Alphaproteobacteria bacterium]|nr:methyltransferase [Alphaproteobacteria bacterium]MBU3974124.1 methyltransferase [Alphaproteobacteria bacterium]MBU4039952.1 methyltransferase [Alphaproteobacteria bacterium]MBU4136063.1 methyltransferase [Alphaproteobacteria bacterium]